MKRLVVLLLLSSACGDADRAPPTGLEGRHLMARTAQLRVSCDDTRRVAREIEKEVASLGGSVASIRLEGDGAAEVEASLRVPAARFDGFVDELRALGSVGSESRAEEDVGAPTLDVQARLDASRVLERELLKMLDRPNASVGDLVAVEGRLTEVREKIEQLEGQQRALRSRVELVNVDLELVHASLGGPYLAQVGAALHGSVTVMVEVARLIGIALAALAPWLLAAAVLWIAVRRAARLCRAARTR